MNRLGSIILYTAIRLALFLVPMGICILLGISPWLSAIFAALIGVSLSILLLDRLRAPLGDALISVRNKKSAGNNSTKPGPDADNDVEDAALDEHDRSNNSGSVPKN